MLNFGAEARATAAINVRVLLALVPTLLIAGPVTTPRVPKLPAWFEPNRGQFPRGMAFFGRSPGYTLSLDSQGASTLTLSATDSAGQVRLDLQGGRATPAIGEDLLPGVTRVYRGPGPTELTAPHFGRLRSAGVYPGIDFLWVASGGGFSYEFHLQPGADAKRIRLHFSGARSLALSPEGSLIVRTAHGQLQFKRPAAFQAGAAGVVEVAAAYAIEGCVATLRLAAYDHTRPILIDPLVTSTYVGGSGFDAVNGMAADAAGNIYLAGETASTNFPMSGARSSVTRSAFVAQLSADLSSIRWVTILASSGNDRASAVAVDSTGNVYVGGSAGAVNFPLSGNALQSGLTAAPAGFVAKLGSSGQLLYSTLIGRDNTAVNAIAVDASAKVYVAGYTSSASFTTTLSAPQRLPGGMTDGFAAKLDLATPMLVYATLIGGSGFDSLAGIAVSPAGTACVAGSTTSAGLPLQNAIQPAFGGSQDALVGCLNASGSAWTFLTYWGGSSADFASAISLGSDGGIIVAGSTMSPNFPVTTNAPSPRDYDAFVTKLRADGSAANFSTLLGGSGSDAATAVAADPLGGVWVGGYTNSTNFPQQLAVQSGFGGGFDGFVAELSSDGATLLLSSYLGGSGDDRVQAMAVKQSGTVAVAGLTSSTNFTTTASAIRPVIAGSYDAFVSAVSAQAASAAAAMPATFTAGTWQLDKNANRSWDGTAIDRQIFLGQAGDIPVTGDWNGDGKSKIGIFRNGLWVLDYNGNGAWDGPPADRFYYLGQPGDIPIVGDWNGDGRAKPGIYRNGLWILDYNGNGQWDGPPSDWFFYLGQAGDTPVVGDWNGDGRAKAGIFRNGMWILDYNGNRQWDGPPTDRYFYLGQAGDTPVLGDWNGDGRVKTGIFRSGFWVLDYDGNGQWDGPAVDRTFSLGQSGSIPVVGDWNGDGHTKAGSFLNGTWLFDLSGAGSAVTSAFGASSGIPLAGKW